MNVKTVFAAAAVGVVLFSAQSAFAAGFYVGADVGRSSTGTVTPGAVMTKSTDTVGGVFAGYQFTPNWGAEIFYTGAGKFAVSNVGATVTGSGKADAWGIVGTGTMPLSNAFSLYARLGYANVKTTASSVGVPTFTGATRNAATYGIGAEYDVNSNLGFRLGWDQYGGATQGGTGVAGAKDNFNISVYSLGLRYNF